MLVSESMLCMHALVCRGVVEVYGQGDCRILLWSRYSEEEGLSDGTLTPLRDHPQPVLPLC